MKKDALDIFKAPKFIQDSGITKEDVWGEFDEHYNKISDGMIVARQGQKCQVFYDTLPYKSVNVKCKKENESVVSYWLEFVHGGGCIQGTRLNDKGEVFIRSEYQCW